MTLLMAEVMLIMGLACPVDINHIGASRPPLCLTCRPAANKSITIGPSRRTSRIFVCCMNCIELNWGKVSKMNIAFWGTPQDALFFQGIAWLNHIISSYHHMADHHLIIILPSSYHILFCSDWSKTTQPQSSQKLPLRSCSYMPWPVPVGFLQEIQ